MSGWAGISGAGAPGSTLVCWWCPPAVSDGEEPGRGGASWPGWRGAVYQGVLGDQSAGVDRQVARFGVEFFQAAQGWRVAVVEDAEVADDLVRVVVEVLTGLCARLYGRRPARRRASVVVGAVGKAA